MGSNEAGEARAGGRELICPCAHVGRQHCRYKRARKKKERKGIDTCTTSIFVGLQVSSAAAARSCECVQWAADEGEPVER